VLDFTGILPGNYSFAFNSMGAVAPCLDRTYQVTVEVLDCSCPPFFDGLSCSNVSLFALNNLNPTGLPVNWFVWSAPVGSNPVTTQGSSLNILNKDAGIYELLVTWLPPPNSICPDSVIVTFELLDPDPLILEQDVSVCNNSGPNGNPILNFDSLIILSGGMGQWTDLNQTGAAGSFPLLDFSGVAPGNYWFSYTQFGHPSCLDQVDSILIKVEDCACPEYDFINPLSRCIGSGPLSLEELNLNAPAGIWSVQSQIPGLFPGTIINDSLFTDQADPGQYVLIYEWDDPDYPNCSDSVHLELILEKPGSAGSSGDTLFICAGEMIDTLLQGFLKDSDSGGAWMPSSLNPATVQGLDLATGRWSGTAPINAGLYMFHYLIAEVAPCPPDTGLVFVRVNPLPIFSLGPDQPLGCQADSLVLEGDLNVSGGNYSLVWFEGQGILSSDEKIIVTSGGLYILEVTNLLTGCINRDSILIYSSDPGPVDFELESGAPTCNQANGYIEVLNVIGGQGPIIYRLNQGAWQTSPRWNNLAAGTYLIEIEDDQGCRLDRMIQLNSEQEFTVSLGGDLIVPIGTEVPLVASLSGNVGVITLVEWSPDMIICPACLEQTFLVTSPSFFTVTVTNSNGCTAADQIYIDVLKESLRFYVPDGFSPNNDGINDQFTIFGNEYLKLIKRLEIFDRWGNALFVREDFEPNEIAAGWDGTYQGRDLDPGVYVYQALLGLADGSTRWIKGEIILIR
jgi:gliding motility-associated-like protein